MVLPLIAAGIGAGASLIGGFMGASAEKQAAQMNYNIALMNYYAQQEQFRQATAEAQKQAAEGKLGTTDAQGNRTYFKPGVGWVTDLSPQQKQLQDMYNAEETAQVAHDIPIKRRVMMENVGRQQKEGGYADAIMAAMQRARPQDPQEIIGQRNLMSAEGINQGTRPAIETATRNALRMGNTTGAADIATRIGVGQGDALRKAFMENEIGARDQSQANFGTAQANLANMYNTFATRASATPDAPYNPRNITGNPAAMSAGNAAQGALLNAYGRAAPELNYQQPVQYGAANTIAQLGNNILGMGQGQDAYNYRQQQQGGYGSYLGNYYGSSSGNQFPSAPSSSMYKGNTGRY
jgi:hypothetical protein